MASLISIITVNYRQAAITCDLLDTLSQLTYPNYEVLLVDNGYQEDESDRFRQHLPAVQVINSKENLGFAGGNNLAIAKAKGEYIFLLNNDTLVPPGLLEPLVELLDNSPKVGVVSPKIYYHDQPQMLQYAGTARLDLYTGRGQDIAKKQVDKGQFDQAHETDFAHGACMMVRREVFEDVGLLSEDYFMYYEELDFCLRVRQHNWIVQYTPATFIHHRESSSMGKTSALKTYYMFRNRWLFIRRFGNVSQHGFFVLYLLVFALPVNLLRFSLKGQWQHITALWNACKWNIQHSRLGKIIPVYPMWANR